MPTSTLFLPSLKPRSYAKGRIHTVLSFSSSGLGPYDAIQFEKYLSDKNVSVAPYIRELGEGFDGQSNKKDLETIEVYGVVQNDFNSGNLAGFVWGGNLDFVVVGFAKIEATFVDLALVRFGIRVGGLDCACFIRYSIDSISSAVD